LDAQSARRLAVVAKIPDGTVGQEVIEVAVARRFCHSLVDQALQGKESDRLQKSMPNHLATGTGHVDE